LENRTGPSLSVVLSEALPPTAIDDAVTRLRRVLEQCAATTLGLSDSALLVALADVVLCFARHELAREREGRR
jgi:hypothetical protein